MPTYFVDPVGGNDANSGLTFAFRKQNVPVLAASDLVRVIASPAVTDTGLSGSWVGSGTATVRRRVTFTGGVITKTVNTANSVWNGSGGQITMTLPAAGKTSTNCNQIAIANGFSTGKIAHFALGATLDLSAFQQLSWHWQVTSGTIPASSLKVCLCSDTTGDVIVDQFVIPYAGAPTSRWYPITVDKGSALGSAIQSIAIYADTDPGVVTFRMGKSIACKAASSVDSLTLSSLAGKSTAGTGDEALYPIRNILDSTETDPADATSGPMIEFETYPSALFAVRARGYVGTTATANIFKREPLPVTPVASGSSWWTASTAGVNISGGWNRTDMSTQTDFTYLRGGGNGYMMTPTGATQVIDKMGGTYWEEVLRPTGASVTLGDIYSGAHESYGVNWGGFGVSRCSMTGSIYSVGGVQGGLNIQPSGNPAMNINNLRAYSSAGTGIAVVQNCTINHYGTIRSDNNGAGAGTLGSGRDYNILNSQGNTGDGFIFNGDTTLTSVKSLTTIGNSGYGFQVSGWGNLTILSLTSNTNTTATMNIAINRAVSVRIGVTSVTDTTLISNGSWTKQLGPQVWFGGLATGAANRGYFFGSEIRSEASDTDVAGLAWRLLITDVAKDLYFPLRLGVEAGDRLRKAVKAGSLVTATIRAKKGNSTVKSFFGVRGGRLSGVPNDVRVEVTAVQAGAGGYATYQITFTPTQAGVVDFYFETYYDTGALDANSWGAFDTLSVTQA